MKQQTLGVIMYLDDNRERYCPGDSVAWGDFAWPANPLAQHGGYVDAIFRYINSAEVFLCPSDDQKNCLSAANVGGAHNFGSDFLQGTYPNQYLSYCYNYNLSRPACRRSSRVPRRPV